MELTLKRNKFIGDTATGEFYTNGQYESVTLEELGKEIPYGRHKVDITWSPTFQRMMPEVFVEGREGIRIHIGNSIADTEGCILPGEYVSEDGLFIYNSTEAYNRLFDKLKEAKENGEDIYIDVVAPDVRRGIEGTVIIGTAASVFLLMRNFIKHNNKKKKRA